MGKKWVAWVLTTQLAFTIFWFLHSKSNFFLPLSCFAYNLIGPVVFYSFIPFYGLLIVIRGVVDSLYCLFIVLQCLDNWIAQVLLIFYSLLWVFWISIFVLFVFSSSSIFSRQKSIYIISTSEKDNIIV